MIAWVPYESVELAREKLGELPDDVELVPFPDVDSWPDSIAEVEFLVLPYMTGTQGLDRSEEMTSLKVVQLQTAGYEGVVERVPNGVTVCNASGVHDASTAELAVGLAIASGRRLDHFARLQAKHEWDQQFGESLADKRVLILGYGGIGESIERRLAGFEVASITRVARSARVEPEVHPVSELAELLPEVDVVFVIVPLSEQTTGLIDAEALAVLPDGALVVNVSRGKVVDTDALLAEVSSGRLRAALDVTDPEPLPPQHPLWDCPNALIVPHVGGASTAFFPRRDRLIAAQLAAFANGETVTNRVN